MSESLCAPKNQSAEVKTLTRGILNLRHALVTTSLAEQHTSRRSMGEDVPANGFAAIGTSEECAGSGVGLDLVCLLRSLVI